MEEAMGKEITFEKLEKILDEKAKEIKEKINKEINKKIDYIFYEMLEKFVEELGIEV
jgi:hypothetical protein